MGGRAVIKFGGADLSSGERIRKAAKMVIESEYDEILVVVSAMGETTNMLINIINQLGGISDKDYAEIVSMGERTSARIFSAALKALGAKSTYIEPSQKRWPIITDSNFIGAKPILDETRRRVKEYIEPLLGDCIPVVCGFLGLDRFGNITTLGRGGSDVTALLLGNCLGADEVILVKTTEGVMSADPKIVPHARPLSRLTIHEMFALAHGGAKIVKAEALRYKLPNQRLRIISFSNGLKSGGTEITGTFNANSFEIAERKGLTAISLVCEIKPRVMSKLFTELNERPIYGVSTGKTSITIFTSAGDDANLIRRIHDAGISKAVSCRGGVGLIEITHPSFIDSPGWVAKISGALASKGINIIEITTSKATINIFIDEARLEDAIKAIGDVIEA